MTVPQNHICFTSSSIISEISKPLFDNSDINFFAYGRFFNRNQCVLFHNNNHLLENWVKFESPAPTCFSDGVHLWDQIIKTDVIKVRNELNLDNGICLINHNEHYTEAFAFSTPMHAKNSMSLYLNQMNVLNKFCLYFKDQASKLIQQGIDNPLVLPDGMLSLEKNADEDTVKDLDKLNVLMDSLKIKNYYFSEKYNGIKLTKREVECLSLYLKGKTSHEIATQLSLNKKTIDTFLSLIKKKFHCRTRSELFEIIWDLGILKSNGWINV
ncbi:MAG: helix-turn-helix transcriptional regulator [Proteobacteria bacterium]|nr:helix-turn-helix transcriptional regulator [Pseudomonadota bacterium]